MTRSKSSLLTSEERVICEQISKNGEELFNQRARVLLALNEGMSQTEAGKLAGLTIEQVDCCLQRFRQLRTASIFSTETHCQKTQDEPEFHSQLNNTYSRIEDSINQLKQADDRLIACDIVSQPDEKNKLTETPDKRKKAGKKEKRKKPKKKPKKLKNKKSKKQKNKKKKKQKK